MVLETQCKDDSRAMVKIRVILEPGSMAAETQIDSFLAQRRSMVESQLRARGIRDERVLAAMLHVPRHEFVSGDYRDQVYEDHPIPIGEGQTLSQPYIVAIMLEALTLQPSGVVLEVGTRLGLPNRVALGTHPGGLFGGAARVARPDGASRHSPASATPTWKCCSATAATAFLRRAPFDAIVVSAAAPQIPSPLFEQLREGGRMVIPVGPAHAQELQLVRKHGGQPVVTNLEGCRFVPLIGSEGYRSGW